MENQPFSIMSAIKKLRASKYKKADTRAEAEKSKEDKNQYGESGHNRSGNYNK